jgi:hypothetical protein
VADRLRELGVPCLDVNVSESPAETDKYSRLRDELWFRLREWLGDPAGASFAALDRDHIDRLIADACEPSYAFDDSGRYRVESKKDVKKRTGRSPDFADAVCLTLAVKGDVRASIATRGAIG